MSRMGSAVVGVLALLCVPACAHRSDVPSFVAPGYPERRFESVGVLANFSDLRVRGTLERLLGTDLRRTGRKVVPSSSLLFPDREYTQEETLAAVRAAGLESLLLLDPTESGEHRWIPLQIDDNTLTRSVVAGHVASEESSARTITVTTGRVPWQRVRVRMLDLSSGKAVWLMDETMRDFKLGALERLVEDIVAGLNETRILGP
jgi:hypothetical protein